MMPTQSKSLTFHHPSPTQNNKIKKPEKVKKDKPMKQVFRGKEMAISGSFENAGQAVSQEKVAKWITLHGGTYVSEVGSETTHLICSIEDWKRRKPQVIKARALGKKCKIVTFDWLEECLTRTNKRLAPTSDYTLQATLQRLQKRNQAEARHKRNFENGVLESESFTGHHEDRDPITDTRKGLHRVYFDSTAFEYKVELKRREVVGGMRTRAERYTLFLFQTIAQPYTYMTAARLQETIIVPNPPSPSNPEGKPTKTHRPISYFRDYCAPKEFHHAFADFKHFFHEKTGLEWDDRLEERIEGRFSYVLPTEGRPLGFLPPGRTMRAVYPELEADGEDVEMAFEIVGERISEVRRDVDIEEGDGGTMECERSELSKRVQRIEQMDTEMSAENDGSEDSIDLTAEVENPEMIQGTNIIEKTDTNMSLKGTDTRIDIQTDTQKPVKNQSQKMNDIIALTTEDTDLMTNEETKTIEETETETEPVFNAQESQELKDSHDMKVNGVVDPTIEEEKSENSETFQEMEDTAVESTLNHVITPLESGRVDYEDIMEDIEETTDRGDLGVANEKYSELPVDKRSGETTNEIRDLTREEEYTQLTNPNNSLVLPSLHFSPPLLLPTAPENQESSPLQFLNPDIEERNNGSGEECAYEISDDDEEAVYEIEEDEGMKEYNDEDEERGGIEVVVVEGLISEN